MMKNLKALLIFAIAILVIPICASASSGTIKVTGPSNVTNGSKVTVSVVLSSSTSIGSWEMELNYDKSYLSLVSSSAENGGTYMVNSSSGTKSKKYTFTFKTLKTGATKVSISSYLVYAYTDMSKMNISTSSKTIKVSEPVNYSSNNYLKSLSIEGANLDFSKEKKSYSVNIEKGKTKIKINGSTDDSKAKVSGLGEKSIEEGDNHFEIKVTAENGSTRTYKINAILEEANPINVKINDSEYRVIKKASLIEAPKGYKEDKITIDEIEVPAFKNETTNLTLIGLKDNDGNIVLAIYDTGKYKIYKELTIGNLKLLELEFPKDKVKSNYEKKEITYNDEIISVYKNPGVDSLYLLYAMNLENGKKNIYQYDDIEKTIQRYVEYKSGVDEDKITDLVIKIGIIIVCSILAFIFVTIKMALKFKK